MLDMNDGTGEVTGADIYNLVTVTSWCLSANGTILEQT